MNEQERNEWEDGQYRQPAPQWEPVELPRSNPQPQYTQPQDPYKNTMVIREDDALNSSYSTAPIQPPKKRRSGLKVLLIVGIVIAGLATTFGLYKLGLVPNILGDFSDFGGSGTPGFSDEDATQATEGEAVPLPSGEKEINVELKGIPEGEKLSLQDVYDKAIPSVVSVICDNGSGTGVVLTSDGYIVTNCHVVDGARTVEVLLTDERTLPARVVVKNATYDLAVLYVNATDLVPAEFGDSELIRVGDTVVAIGDPLGVELRGTMTDGIVSAINRNIDMGDGSTMNVIQTDVALNPGNSGGPLVNIYGQVVGINTMKIGDDATSAGVEGLGFAIPSATVKSVVEQMMNQGYVSGNPSLGITVRELGTRDLMYYVLPEGLYVSDVENGSDAEAQGIEVGDVLVKFNDKTITDEASLRAALAECQVGDTVKLTLTRREEEYTVEIVLTEEA